MTSGAPSRTVPRSVALRSALVVTLAIALSPRIALADAPTPARLSWTRGEGAERCPDTASIASSVVALLQGADPFHTETPATLSIEAAIERDEDGWHARIYDRDSTGALVGARSFDTDEPGCEGVAQASALSIALALNHGALPHPVAAPPAQTAPTTVATPAQPAVATVRSAATSTRARRAVSVTARVAVASGFTPDIAPLFALHAEGTAYGPLRWMAETFSVGASSPDDAANYEFHTVGGRLGACLEAWRSRVIALEGCASLTGAGLLLTVTRAQVDEAPSGLWLGASIDAAVRVTPIRPLVIEAGVSGAMPFTRPRFEDAANRGAASALVYESPLVAAMGWLGAGVSIP